MEIKNKCYKNTLYLVLSGELDEYSANYTKTTIDELLSNENFNQVVIDLSELEFMDSTGVGVLIGRYKKLKAQNKAIYVCNPSNQAEKLFNMTGLYQIMPKIN